MANRILKVIVVMAGEMQPDWLGDWLIPALVAVLGLIGVGVGAWLASGSALRIRLMDLTQRLNETQRDFQIRAVSAVNALGIAMALAVEHKSQSLRAIIDDAVARARAAGVAAGTIQFDAEVRLPNELDEGVKAATAAWRAVLAEAQAFTDSTMAAAFEEFDAQRELVVKAANAASDLAGLENAMREAERLRGDFGPQIYRVLQLEKVKGSWRMYQLAHVRGIRRLARQISSATATEIERGEELIKAQR